MAGVQGNDCVFLCGDDAMTTELDKVESRRRIFLCLSLSDAHIEDSTFLEGLSGTTGLASLPREVSSDDFQLWYNSSPLRPPPDQQLCRVVKVC